jgi:LIVCS family branched-chain amino acid:cation transporter
MNRFFLYKGLSVGLMIFSMAFGAGNLIYPLSTGYHCSENGLFGFLGFFMSSILLPLIAFFSTAIYEGDYKKMLSENSFWFVAEIVTLVSMLLLGPAGCIPRCAITANASIGQYLFINPLLFNALFFLGCYLIARNKSNLIKVLGNLIAPMTLTCLGMIIFLGIIKDPNIADTSVSQAKAVAVGFYNGCFTFDLLALLFYSRVIFQVVTSLFFEHEDKLGGKQNVFKFLRFSGLMACMFFVLIYGGMTLCASLHSGSIDVLFDSELISKYSNLILGSQFGIIYSAVVFFACFSTTLALLVVFSDYLANLLKNIISYQSALLISTASSFLLANLDFKQVSNLMSPMMFLIYPILIPLVLIVFFKNIKKIISG